LALLRKCPFSSVRTIVDSLNIPASMIQNIVPNIRQKPDKFSIFEECRSGRDRFPDHHENKRSLYEIIYEYLGIYKFRGSHLLVIIRTKYEDSLIKPSIFVNFSTPPRSMLEREFHRISFNAQHVSKKVTSFPDVLFRLWGFQPGHGQCGSSEI
jgi:hypothetical protein